MIEKIFPSKRRNAPRKKFRGKKRYFRRLLLNAQEFQPSLGPDDWYDLWHDHADWYGYGNLRWKYRVKHIETLCMMFRKFANGLDSLEKPYQLFISLDQDDAGQDSINFHTPNPNHSEFPRKFAEVQWGIPVIEEYFSKILSPYNIRSGQFEWQGSTGFLVYSPELGVPLE